MQRIESYESFTEIIQTFICDLLAPMSKSAKSAYKNLLQLKVKIDKLQDIEYFESFTKVVQTLICNFRAAVSKSTSLSYKRKVTN